MQVGLDAVEPFFEGDPVDFADQLIRAMRDELGHDRAENQQRGHRLSACDHAGESDRHDVAVTDRGRGHEAEVDRADETVEVAAERAAAFDQTVLAGPGAEPEAQSAEQDRPHPEDEELQGRLLLDQVKQGPVEPAHLGRDARRRTANFSVGRDRERRSERWSEDGVVRLGRCSDDGVFRLGGCALSHFAGFGPVGEAAAIVANFRVAEFMEEADGLAGREFK